MSYLPSTDPIPRTLAAMTRGVMRFGWLVALASLALTIAGAIITLNNLAVDTNTDNMLSAQLPFRQAQIALDQAFPQDVDTLVLVLDGEDSARVDALGNALKARLEAERERFGPVFDPAGEAVFRTNALLFLDTEALSQLTDQLATAQPFLGAIAADPSLRGLFGVLTLAAGELATDPARAGGSGPLALAPVLQAIADQIDADRSGTAGRLDWSQWLGGESASLAALAGGSRIMVLQPSLDFTSLRPGAQAMADVRAAAKAVGIDATAGVRLRLTGPVALSEEELDSAEFGQAKPELISFALVTLISLWCFRSGRMSLAALLTVVAGLAWTATFAATVAGPLNLVSVAFFVLFIGFAIDFGIHYGLRYKEGLALGLDHGGALARAAAGVGVALALCALCAALGFFSFLPTTYIGLQQLGFVAGFGMAIAFFSNMVLFPALLTVLPGRTTVKAGEGAYQGGAVSRWIEAHPRAILTVTAVLAVAATVIAPAVRFDFDPLNLKDPKSESVEALRDLLAAGRQEGYAISVIVPTLEEAEALAERARQLPEVGGAATIASFVPDDQEEKLALIDAVALMLGPSLEQPPLPPPSLAETDEAFARFASALSRLAASGPAGADEGDEASANGEAAGRLLVALTAWRQSVGGNANNLARLEQRLVADLPDRLKSLREVLAPPGLSIEALPEDLRRRWVAADGRHRVEIYPPAGTAGDSERLARFVAAVQTIAPDAAGPPVMIVGAGREIVKAFVQAAGTAIAAIGLVLAFVLKRVRDVAFSFVPLVLAALFTMAASILIDVPFNFANVIVLPLLFGLGVTASLNLVVRERQEGAAGQMMSSCTPRAVVFSALTMISAFGTLALSQHPGISSMGLLLAIAIALTLVCTVVVLPALMTLIRRRTA